MPGQSDPYTTLSEIAQLVAQFYGAVYPHDPARSRVVKWLGEIGCRVGSRRITGNEVKTALVQLAKLGIVNRGGNGGFGPRAHPTWALPLTIVASRAGLLDDVVRVFNTEIYAYSWGTPPAKQIMMLRYYVVAGRYDEIIQLGDLSVESWRFLAHPEAAPLLRALPETYVEVALLSCLLYHIDTAAPPEPLIALCNELAPERASLASHIAFLRILQGRFDDALRGLDELPERIRTSKSAEISREAARALIATLRGKDEVASAHIESALVAEKKGTRKRNVFPSSMPFALALLSLVRIGTADARARLDRLLKTSEQQQILTEMTRYARIAATIQHNPQADMDGLWPNGATLITFLRGLACCWMDEALFLDLPHARQSLHQFVTRAATNGYGWLAAEGVEILRLGNGGDENLDLSMESIATHDELGTVTLTTLITPLEPWEYPLNALEQLALAARARPTTKNDAKPAQQRRLLWELTMDEYGIVDLKGREQTANKRGGWSRGRAVSLKRLRSDAPAMNFLIEQDRAAASAIQEQRYGWGYGRQHSQFHAGEKSLYALVGHPLVVDENTDPLEIIRRDPELIISEQPEGLVAHIEPHGENHGDYRVVKSGARRVEVTHFSAAHKRLFELIPEQGLHLPLAAKARLMEAVSALSRQIRIHSSVGGEHFTATQIIGTHEPWVQIVPAGTGLSVTLLVEPVPESGVYVDPGKGGDTLLVEHSGETIEAKRDHAAENAAVDALVDSCHSLRRAYDGRNFYRYSAPADCLELLEELHTVKARCLWPKGESYRVVAHADTSQLNLTIKHAQQWFAASGSLRVNEDKVLGLAELLSLLEASPHSRFLEIDDGQFIALSESFRRQLDELQGLSTPAKGKSIRFHQLAAPALEELVEQSNCDVDDEWRLLRTRLKNAQTFRAELPGTLRAELRPYQLDGFRWLAQVSNWGVGACLADDMGLGKTVEALALLLHRASGGPALVVAPTSVVTNWVEEAQRFAPTLNVILYSGTAKTRGRILGELAPFDVVVITYGLLQNDLAQLADIEWHNVVLDEAQNIKNAATKRAQAARRLSAQFRLATTGTPIQNNLMDLHSLFNFLNPGLLGSAAQFRTRFQLPIERDGDAEVRARLRRLISPFVLRRTKTEVLDDLPSRTEITLHVELSQPEATLYEVLRRKAVEHLKASKDKSSAGSRHLQVLAHLTKLRLACCHPKLVQKSAEFGSAKLAMFAETLTELLENRHKVLVFSQFVMHLKIIEAYLEETGVSFHYLDGKTPLKTRAKRIAEFQNGTGDVFLISLKAGGTGLNLTAADYVIHMDPWWNPAVEDQASDRAHRIGQTRPVTIYRLVTTGTVEEQIVELHHKKRDLADRLLEGTDAPTRLNVTELLELLHEPL